MKIRVKMPNRYYNDLHDREHFIDDILLWGMEVDMDVEYYKLHVERNDAYRIENIWAVFSVEADNAFMFSLKWGAQLHKKQREGHDA